MKATTLCLIVLLCIYSVSSQCVNCTSKPGVDKNCCDENGCITPNVFCRDVDENDYCHTDGYCTADGKCPKGDVEDGTVQWDWLGESGKFRYWICDHCCNNGHKSKWMKISPEDITEVGPGAKKKLSLKGHGKAWKKWQLNSKDYDISRFSVAPTNFYSLGASLPTEDGNQTFQFTVFYFGDESSYTLGDNTYAIQAKSLKFDLVFPTPWPFANPNNTLTFRFRIQTPKDELNFETLEDGTLRAQLPDDQGYVSFPTKNAVYIDDKEFKDVNVTTKGKGSNAEILIDIPYFEKSARLDPDAFLNNGQEKMGPFIVLLLLSLLVLLF